MKKQLNGFNKMLKRADGKHACTAIQPGKTKTLLEQEGYEDNTDGYHEQYIRSITDYLDQRLSYKHMIAVWAFKRVLSAAEYVAYLDYEFQSSVQAA